MQICWRPSSGYTMISVEFLKSSSGSHIEGLGWRGMQCWQKEQLEACWSYPGIKWERMCSCLLVMWNERENGVIPHLVGHELLVVLAIQNKAVKLYLLLGKKNVHKHMQQKMMISPYSEFIFLLHTNHSSRSSLYRVFIWRRIKKKYQSRKTIKKQQSDVLDVGKNMTRSRVISLGNILI